MSSDLRDGFGRSFVFGVIIQCKKAVIGKRCYAACSTSFDLESKGIEFGSESFIENVLVTT